MYVYLQCMLSATHGTTIYCAASASALAQSYAEMLAPQPLQTRTSNTPALTLLRTPLPRRREKKEEHAPRALHHAEENACGDEGGAGEAAHLSTLLYSTFLTLKLSTVRLDAERELTEKLT